MLHKKLQTSSFSSFALVYEPDFPAMKCWDTGWIQSVVAKCKSCANYHKHGINFVDAQKLWDDLGLVEIPARTDGEPRWLVVGRLNNLHYAAIITYREDRIRLISVRRARIEEVRIYEN